MSQDHKHSAARWSLTIVAVLVFYLLLPVPVMVALMKIYDRSIPKPMEDVVGMVFFPVFYAIGEWEPVENFYKAELRLFGVEL